MKTISIIIVSYNTKELTLACLKSIYDQTKSCSFQVILVDNNSSDGSADEITMKFPQIELIRLHENIGFARANNLAATHVKTKHILLLNPDTVILDNAIEKLLAFAEENANAGIWGGKTLFANGSLNPTSCWRQSTLWSLFCRASHLSALLPRFEIFNPESYGTWQRDTVRKVDIVTGCFFLIYTELWNELNGFDPVFFMYGEEADLCLRAQNSGYEPMVTPNAVIIHYGGASEKVRADKIIKLLGSKVLLINKHWNYFSIFIGIILIKLWIIIKITLLKLILLIKPSQKYNEMLTTWSSVWKSRKTWQ